MFNTWNINILCLTVPLFYPSRTRYIRAKWWNWVAIWMQRSNTFSAICLKHIWASQIICEILYNFASYHFHHCALFLCETIEFFSPLRRANCIISFSIWKNWIPWTALFTDNFEHCALVFCKNCPMNLCELKSWLWHQLCAMLVMWMPLIWLNCIGCMNWEKPFSHSFNEVGYNLCCAHC